MKIYYKIVLNPEQLFIDLDNLDTKVFEVNKFVISNYNTCLDIAKLNNVQIQNIHIVKIVHK